MTLHVRVDDESGKLIIDLLINLVANDSEQVETRKNRVRQINVVIKVELGSVNAANRVGSCDH